MNSRLRFIPFAAAGLLLGLLALPRVWATPGMRWAFVGAAVSLAILTLAVRARARREGRPLVSQVSVRTPHVVQLLVQAGVYVYWGWYWPEVYAEVPMLVAQLAFAYGLDACLSWSRFGNWRVGFGPWPVIGSLNLFMWFHDDYYALQFVLVAVAYLTRFYVLWRRPDRTGHIFNPSGIALASLALALILGGWTDITRSADIAAHLNDGPYIHIAIFALGMTVQSFVPVVLITASAAITVLLADWWTIHTTGFAYFGAVGIPPAVFLGMNLLITDPASSPRRALAKVMYGVAYGGGVLLLYPVLRDLADNPAVGGPAPLAHFDKLLMVPILNVLVPQFDALARRLWDRGRAVSKRANWGHQLAWLVVFVVTLPTIRFTQGVGPGYWGDLCAGGNAAACGVYRDELVRLCKRGLGLACQNLGVAHEFGELGAPNLAAAKIAYEWGCALKVGDSCSHLGVVSLHTKDDPVHVRALFEDACGYGSAEGCEKLGLALLNGVGGPLDPAAGRAALAKACAGGVEPACALVKPDPSGGRPP